MTTPITSQGSILAAQRILEAISEEAPVAKMISDGDPRVANLNAFNRQNIVRTQLVMHAWKKIGRQVLAMHPAVVDEVAIATSDKVPGEVLRTLPYMNPLVVYGEPPEFKTWVRPGDSHRLTGNTHEAGMRLLGFLTYGSAHVRVNEPILHDNDVKPGVRIEQRIYPSNSTDADRFGIMLILEVLDDVGKTIDIEMTSVTIFFGADQTLAEVVDDLLTRFAWDIDPSGKGDVHKDGQENRRQRKWMREVLAVVVGSLFYLCSTTLEAEKVPTHATRNLGRGITRKPISLYRVGWTTGAALTRYRQSRAAAWNESGQTDITHQQDPQHRRAHFKMQPCGPRNSERKLIFVSAYWTHIERLGVAGMNTARAVPLVNGKGTARDSTQTALGMRGVVGD